MSKWLQSLKLDKLIPVFEKRGICTVEQVCMLKEADVSSMSELSGNDMISILAEPIELSLNGFKH